MLLVPRTCLFLPLLLAAGAARGGAQENPQPPPSGGPMVAPGSRLDWFAHRRARLGISVNVRSRVTDSIGAYVNSVTPGGPAAKAGLKSGDIITRIDGTALVGGDLESAPDQSAPGLRLIEQVARLQPNDTIAMEFRRGAIHRTVPLVTGDEPATGMFGPDGFALRINPDEAPGDESGEERFRHRIGDPGAEGLPYGAFTMTFNSPLADLELAPINPALGRYFGVASGVLVIDLPDSSPLGLKPGDVVLAVGGRVPSNPPHLIRILLSYDAGEEIRMDVMRMKRRESVTGHLDQK